jgi:hypothetical protein
MQAQNRANLRGRILELHPNGISVNMLNGVGFTFTAGTTLDVIEANILKSNDYNIKDFTSPKVQLIDSDGNKVEAQDVPNGFFSAVLRLRKPLPRARTAAS